MAISTDGHVLVLALVMWGQTLCKRKRSGSRVRLSQVAHMSHTTKGHGSGFYGSPFLPQKNKWKKVNCEKVQNNIVTMSKKEEKKEQLGKFKVAIVRDIKPHFNKINKSYLWDIKPHFTKDTQFWEIKMQLLQNIILRLKNVYCELKFKRRSKGQVNWEIGP